MNPASVRVLCVCLRAEKWAANFTRDFTFGVTVSEAALS